MEYTEKSITKMFSESFFYIYTLSKTFCEEVFLLFLKGGILKMYGQIFK